MGSERAAAGLHRTIPALPVQVSRGGVETTDFGTRELATVDLDGNLLAFFRWQET